MKVRTFGVIGALIVGLVSCSGGKDIAAANAGVDRFREQVAQGQFVEMAKEWEPVFSNRTNSDDIARAMEDLSLQLGAPQSSRQVSRQVKYATGDAVVTLEYETVFEKKGKAKERFVFHVRDGEAHLARHHIGGVSIQ